jgi:hypothetical protein
MPPSQIHASAIARIEQALAAQYGAPGEEFIEGPTQLGPHSVWEIMVAAEGKHRVHFAVMTQGYDGITIFRDFSEFGKWLSLSIPNASDKIDLKADSLDRLQLDFKASSLDRLQFIASLSLFIIITYYIFEIFVQIFGTPESTNSIIDRLTSFARGIGGNVGAAGVLAIVFGFTGLIAAATYTWLAVRASVFEVGINGDTSIQIGKDGIDRIGIERVTHQLVEAPESVSGAVGGERD